MTWGPVVSREAIVVNQVAARYNIVQVGLASSNTLSNRSVYPYTVQTFPTGRAVNEAMVEFSKQMGWTRVAFIHEEIESFRQIIAVFLEVLEREGLQLVASEGVKDVSLMDVHLQNLKRQDARIIFTGFNKAETLKLVCQAYLSGMYGAKYVWIAPSWATTVWWLDASPSVIHPCTQQDIDNVVEFMIHFNINQRQSDLHKLDYNGVKPLPSQYDYFNSMQPISNIAYTYDGIIAIALALNKSLPGLQRLDPPRSLEEFSYSDSEMAEVILRSADDVDFIGLVGRVLITNGQRRTDKVYIDQAQSGALVPVMTFETQTRRLVTSLDSTIKWQGGFIPVDGTTKRTVILQVSWAVRATIFSLAGVGIIMGLAFLYLNIRYKGKRAIKLSSPPLGNLTLIGSLLLYASVFASGWDDTDLSDTAIVFKCHLERILISLGLSLSFGSIFMKTYRIHAIFTLAVKRLKHIDLPDWKLISGVALTAAVDCAIFTLWVALDSTTVESRSFEPKLNMTEPEKELFDVPVIRYCDSAHAQYFIIAIYGVKGILLTFGLFLAWETRNIAISQLNDSKYIAASVYVVCLTIVLTVPTMTLLADDVNMTFAIPVVAIVVVNTTVMCLNFIPKVYLLVSVDDKDVRISIMQSMGYGGETTGIGSSSGSQADRTDKLSKQRSMVMQMVLEQLCRHLQRLQHAMSVPM
ncbi:gamma-aminobutyric acid type B receptor subunit 2-like isoform X1 [Asterias amurensis]|uniref:gamma-aminobutyric acid type B receptor subunit 2-like isoform X1 n=1 Tax=Asterias amurensis TaxID=7602 RepID=UPI003AB22562